MLDEALLAADVIVVLWSQKALASDWVKHEASVGKARGILVPAKIEECDLPATFAALQTTNLVGWDGSEQDGRFRALLSSVKMVISRRRRAFVLRALVAGFALAAVAAIGVEVGRRHPVASDSTREAPSLPVSQSRAPASAIRAAPPSQGSDELGIARQIEKLVSSGQYEPATKLFAELRASHFSGVGYSAYPEAAFAFDQIGESKNALQVIAFLKQRMDDDASKGYGYLAPGRPPRQFLRDDFHSLLPRMKDPDVRKAVSDLSAVL